jgi:hypothetical protein
MSIYAMTDEELLLALCIYEEQLDDPGACPEFCVNGIGLNVVHPVFKLDSKV